jgi:hypothetical protein
MKPRYLFNFRIPLLFFLLTACSTARINISVLQPAKIALPATIQRVSLFPGAGIPDPPGVFDSISHIGLTPDYNYNRIKRGYIEGVYEIMSASPRFKRVVLSDSSFENLLTTGVLTWDELRQVCSHDSTEAVLLLKKAVSMDSIDYIEYDTYNATQYRIINLTKWQFYEPFAERTSEELKICDTIYFEHKIYRWNIKIDPRDIPSLLYDACHNTGIRLGNQICPVWKDTLRVMYKGPGASLKQACSFAKNNQWHQAGAIWNDLANSTDHKQASRASFNLALAWEQDDNIEQAVEWINYADSLAHTQKTKTYKKILKNRLKNKQVLDHQITGNN